MTAMELVFATNNPNKLKEIRELLNEGFAILSLDDVGFQGDIPETQDTLEGNASQKAFYIYNKTGMNCFADDTGLEIEALNGRPGVYSARYAGLDCSPEDNIQKVLKEMEGVNNRAARFRTVISLVMNGKEEQFEGVVNGKILEANSGNSGFGYDPIFKPEGYSISFAEMDMAQKNRISHRGIAVRKLATFLKTLMT